MTGRLPLLLLVVALTYGISGCSLKYTIEEPVPSRVTYQNVEKKPLVMKIVDERIDKKFSPGITGLKSVDIIFENVEDPVGWLAKGLEKEFSARGVPMQAVTSDVAGQPALTLTVKRYQVVNHRASGFSAWEAYHLFLGQVTMGEKSCTIPAYFFNSKIPVWSMDEIGKPCLSTPMSVMVKEIAAKINRCVFNYSASDAEVEKMTAAALAEVKGESDTACFPSIELGITNNPAALSALQKIAENENSLVHNCAVSAIGLLGVPGQFDYLADKFRKFTNNDKAMPLKAIGDYGNSKSMEFLDKLRSDKLYEDENSVRYCVDLYLAK